MGMQPEKFDILFWNSDNTRLPAAMHSYYLRNMYMKNLLSKAGGLKFDGQEIDLGNIKIPTYVFATSADHISPWRSVFKASKLYGGETRLVLGGSGHVAGVVNHPDKNKYWYAIVDDSSISEESLVKKPGSWWSDWSLWLSKKLGKKMVKAEPVQDYGLGDAPGSYVKMK